MSETNGKKLDPDEKSLMDLAAETLKTLLKSGQGDPSGPGVSRTAWWKGFEGMIGTPIPDKIKAMAAFKAHANTRGEGEGAVYIDNDAVQKGKKKPRKSNGKTAEVAVETAIEVTTTDRTQEYEGGIKYARVGMVDGTSHNHLGKIKKVIIIFSGPAALLFIAWWNFPIEQPEFWVRLIGL